MLFSGAACGQFDSAFPGTSMILLPPWSEEGRGGQAEVSGLLFWAVPPLRSEASPQFPALHCLLENEPTVGEQDLPPTLHCVGPCTNYGAICEVIWEELPFLLYLNCLKISTVKHTENRYPCALCPVHVYFRSLSNPTIPSLLVGVNVATILCLVFPAHVFLRYTLTHGHI